MQKVVTLREKACIFAFAAGYIETWSDCFAISQEGDEGTIRRKAGFNSMVSRWKQRQDIQDTYINAQRFFYRREEQLKEELRQEMAKEGREMEEGGSKRTEAGPTAKRGAIDYTNPENQAKKLNELINRADNTGEALDALKVIISSQRADRDAARDGKQVRAYIPITCDNCPLYETAKNRLQ